MQRAAAVRQVVEIKLGQQTPVFLHYRKTSLLERGFFDDRSIDGGLEVAQTDTGRRVVIDCH